MGQSSTFSFSDFNIGHEIKFTNTSLPRPLGEIISYSQYSRARPGLWVAGYCMNPVCFNKKKYQFSSLGLQSFDVAKIKVRTPCPFCGQFLQDVTKAAIFNCQLVGVGQKTQEIPQKKETIFEYSISKPDTFLLFGQLDHQIIRWDYLTLKATVPKKCPQQHTLLKYQETLSIWQCSQCKKHYDFYEKSKYCRCRQCYYLCWKCL